MKLGNEILFQYHHEKVISVVGSRQGQKVLWCWTDYQICKKSAVLVGNDFFLDENITQDSKRFIT